MRPWRPLACCFLFAAVLTFTARSALADTGPPLEGELLNGTNAADPAATTIDCAASPGGTSTVSYVVTGVAVGPYPGPFTESGQYTVRAGLVESFTASFEIDAVDAVVTGTKGLSSGFSVNFGDCRIAPELPVASISDVSIPAGYHATITTPTGSFTDAGITAVSGEFLTLLDGQRLGGIQESFHASSPPPPPPPPSTSGFVTGGGYVDDPTGRIVNFGLVARSDLNGADGTCDVMDHPSGRHVKCLDVTQFAEAGTHVTFSGQATVDGVPTTYTIDLDDLGQPGAGADTFKIATGSGYTVAGVLEGGNVQTHS